MTNKELKTLKKCISEKWHVLATSDKWVREPDCALCELHEDDCEKCVVYRKTGKIDCRGTPYYAWRRIHESNRYQNKKAKAATLKELYFLVSLLPEGETVITDDGWEYYNV